MTGHSSRFAQHNLLGIGVHDLSEAELQAVVEEWLAGDQARTIVTPNPEFVLRARQDKEFRRILQAADLALPDGVGLRFAVAALSNDRLQHRHTGADTMVYLADLCTRKHKRLMLLGGVPRKTERAAAILAEQFPGIDVVTFDPGIIDEHHVRLSEATLTGVERLAPDVIAIALGQVKQEKVMEILQHKIPTVRLLIGVGGSADYVSKAVQRAPKAWQRYGFEWAWRLVQEPRRAKRIFRAVIVFPLSVTWAAIQERRLFRALYNVAKELKLHFSNSRSG